MSLLQSALELGLVRRTARRTADWVDLQYSLLLEQIAKAAVEDGILDKAKTNARTSVTALLEGLGFKTVDVE